VDSGKTRPLGASGLEVSAISLGSWRTFEQMSREDGVAVMLAARELGINFLDDARYNDESGAAPIATGYSEVVFGELFRAAGWPRDETVVANKLWWEFWPDEDATGELKGSLTRMGLNHVDVIYSLPPPGELGVKGALEQVASLLSAGLARTWGIANWPAAMLSEASRLVPGLGMPRPVAAQLAYSVVERSPVEDPEMVSALRDSGAGVVASFVLAGGVLTGKYATDPNSGRAAGSLEEPPVARARRAATALCALGAELTVSAAALAVAFVLANASVTSALLGATSPGQLRETASGASLAGSLGEADLEKIRAIGAGAA
jgi:aryl-alcohol dehydrogenase-like predicted oxidoreductase